MKDRTTNREFAEQNAQFRAACEAVGLEPTSRQAGKWRRGEGAALKGHKSSAAKS